MTDIGMIIIALGFQKNESLTRQFLWKAFKNNRIAQNNCVKNSTVCSSTGVVSLQIVSWDETRWNFGAVSFPFQLLIL